MSNTTKSPKVYPVIHFRDKELALSETALTKELGCDGVFLISHHGDDNTLVEAAVWAKELHPDFKIGINLLSKYPQYACTVAQVKGLDMVWSDDMGVSSKGLNDVGNEMVNLSRRFPHLELFASVAFKYQAPEPDPVKAATLAQGVGFIPTTSGTGTGIAADLGKIKAMSEAVDGNLAIASGITPENVMEYAPFLSHILVATGISQDEYRINPSKLKELLSKVK